MNDSATARASLRHALASEGDLEIVQELPAAHTVAEVVTSVEPDVVLMDIHMPGIDGFAAAREVRRVSRVPILMITGSTSASEVAVAMEGLRAGAIAVLPMPPAPTDADYELRRRAIVLTIRSAAALPRRRDEAPEAAPRSPPASPRPRAAGTFEVAGIVASLGGPPVLAEIFGKIPQDHPPILLVQHIEPSFVPGFVEWLATATRRNVRLAQHDEPLARSTIYVPPADHHLGATAAGRIELSSAPPVSGFRPSGTVLLTSLARAFGRRAVGIVLTGMGRDGAAGALALHRAGGYVIAQEEATCAVASMPNTARQEGAVDVSLPPPSVPDFLH